MIEKGKVIQIKDKMARIEIKRASACGESCGNCKGSCDTPHHYVDATNSVGAKAGDLVTVEMSTKVFLKATAIAYGIPLLMLIIGVVSGSQLFRSLGININSDLASLLLGLGLLATSYFIINKLDKMNKKNGAITLIVTRILE